MKLTNSNYSIVALLCILSFTLGGFMAGDDARSKITAAMVQQAENIIGIDFTAVEADSMLGELNDQLKKYDELHKLSLANSVTPALQFNPLPAGYRYPDTRNQFSVAGLQQVQLPANRNDLAYYTIGQLAGLLKSRKITSVELTRFYLERLKTYNPKLLNVITLTDELALKQAAKADAEIKAGKYRGLLHGIPYGAKDLLATRIYPTTYGSAAYKSQVFKEDATVIRRLEEAGAVLVAKLSLGELAMDDEWFGGITKNPWDIKRGSSGSSAGSASAVAAGCLPFAIGSETWGSIVSPSNECGVTGLRPTFGRVSKHGAMALSWSMDKLGPIARTVEDCAIVFNAIKGPDGLDLSVIDAPFSYNPEKNLNGLRIGYLKDEFEDKYDNKQNDSLTLMKLKSLGAELVPVTLPHFPYDALTVILSAESAAAFDELTLSNRDTLLVRQRKQAWPNYFRASRFIPAVEYIQANRARTLLIAQLNEKLKNIDLYMSPSFTDNLLATNLTGHPCVVLPNGTNKKGLPASITFIGQLFGEGKLLQAAQVYQSATAFNKKHPAMNF